MLPSHTPNWNELLAQTENRAHFIQRTAEQIEKDFHRAGHPIELNLKDPDQAREQILDALSSALKEISPSVLPTLIYLVDLPETLFNQLNPGESSYCMELAELILLREAHKVFMRQKYA
jgi:hypothetical protein